MLESIGGRRFTMAMGAGVVASVLVWFGKITPDVYQWIVLGTVGAYIAGNTAQKVLPTNPADRGGAQ
jgi:hypothetical protein